MHYSTAAFLNKAKRTAPTITIIRLFLLFIFPLTITPKL
jgi:hypothetical protein